MATKIAISVVIDQLIRRMRFKADGTARANALAALNRAEQFIAQRYPVSYLQVEASVTVNSSLAIATAPADIDESKDITIERADGLGAIPYRPRDEFRSLSSYAFGAWDTTSPYDAWTKYYDSGTNPPTLKFRFSPANTTGGNLILPIIYQMIPPALVDSNSLFSMLPAGYELTVLLDRAEADEKRVANVPGWEILLKKSEMDLEESFYPAFRVSKEKTMTDDEQQRRLVEKRKLADGAQ